jgi:hypothetical protein
MRAARLAVAAALLACVAGATSASAWTCSPHGIRQNGYIGDTGIPYYEIYWVC